MERIIAYFVLGLILATGIECCGKHIGKGISQIKITIVQGETNG